MIIVNDIIRGGSRTAVTSNIEHFVIIVNGFQPLTIITKSSILDVEAVLDLPLIIKLIALSSVSAGKMKMQKMENAGC